MLNKFFALQFFYKFHLSSKTMSEFILITETQEELELQHIESSIHEEVDPQLTMSRTWIRAIYPVLLKNWFLIGLVIVIVLAYIWPYAGSKESPLNTNILVGYVVTSLIFLLSGIGLKTNVLLGAFKHWKLILLIQTFSFGVTPLVAFALSKILNAFNYDVRLSQGIIIACSTPTTIASNVLMTKQAGGNDAAALINAALGNLLGILVSPFLIFLYLQMNPSKSIGYASIFLKLGLTVLLPLITGNIIQYYCPQSVAKLRSKINLSNVNSTLLLFLIWTVFCDTFQSKVFETIPPAQTALTAVISLFLFLLFSAMCFGISLGLSFNRGYLLVF